MPRMMLSFKNTELDAKIYNFIESHSSRSAFIKDMVVHLYRDEVMSMSPVFEKKKTIARQDETSNNIRQDDKVIAKASIKEIKKIEVNKKSEIKDEVNDGNNGEDLYDVDFNF